MNQRGQALVEFSLAAALAAIVICGGACLVGDAWNRTRCAWIVFEATHSRLTGRSGSRPEVRILELPDRVRGEANCGGAREQVELFRLEVSK